METAQGQTHTSQSIPHPVIFLDLGDDIKLIQYLHQPVNLTLDSPAVPNPVYLQIQTVSQNVLPEIAMRRLGFPPSPEGYDFNVNS